MFRNCLALLAGLCVVPAATASWADAMFQELSKDFGSVPRGPALQHAFALKNNTGDVVHVAAPRVSCGCVTATVLKSVLQPGEETAVVAQMDTTRFTGAKHVTIYVPFTHPRSEEARLWVRANGRDDITVTPDTLAFGHVKRGSEPSAAVKVTFLGNGLARVVEVRSESNYVRPAVREVLRQGAEVAYEVSARLRPDAPVGKWYTDVWVTTDIEAMPRLRVPLTVEVESALSVSPAALSFGEVKVGQEAERRVIVRGAKPFKITGVRGTDAVLSIRDSANVTKPVHVLTVKVRGQEAGELNRSLRILTDLDGESSIDFATGARIVP